MTTTDPREAVPPPPLTPPDGTEPRPQSLGEELRSSLLLFVLALAVTAGFAGVLSLVSIATGG
jgi:hypothetical protein